MVEYFGLSDAGDRSSQFSVDHFLQLGATMIVLNQNVEDVLTAQHDCRRLRCGCRKRYLYQSLASREKPPSGLTIHKKLITPKRIRLRTIAAEMLPRTTARLQRKAATNRFKRITYIIRLIHSIRIGHRLFIITRHPLVRQYEA